MVKKSGRLWPGGTVLGCDCTRSLAAMDAVYVHRKLLPEGLTLTSCGMSGDAWTGPISHSQATAPISRATCLKRTMDVIPFSKNGTEVGSVPPARTAGLAGAAFPAAACGACAR